MTDAKNQICFQLRTVTENLEQVSAQTTENKKTDRKVQTIYERF